MRCFRSGTESIRKRHNSAKSLIKTLFCFLTISGNVAAKCAVLSLGITWQYEYTEGDVVLSMMLFCCSNYRMECNENLVGRGDQVTQKH